MSEVNEVNEPSPEEMTELEKLIRSSKPWFESNGTILIYALAAVLLVAAAVVYFNRQPDGNVQATSDLMLASSAEEYRDVADAYQDMELGTWARLQQADRLLDECVGGMFSDRKEGLELLDQAATTYQRLADSDDLPDAVRERVIIGQARLKEVECDGTSESAQAAIAAWQKVLDEYPDTIIKDHAESRIAQLDTEDSRRFYAWFHSINPEPIDPGLSEGQPIVPDLPEGMEGLLDGAGPGSLPTETDGDDMPADTDNTDEGATEAGTDGSGDAPVVPEIPEAAGTGGTPTEPPAGDTPAADTPAGDSPATDTPTEEPPATETPADPAPETPADPPAAGSEPGEDQPK